MKSSYRKLGPFIRKVDIRNIENNKDNLLGVSTRKIFINSVANTEGTDYRKYKIVKRHQFTYVPDTSRRGDKIGIAMLKSHKKALVSQAYIVFEIVDKTVLDPEYLMMWFRRQEFDRYARFKSHGSVREIFDWEEMCDVELPIPSIEIQRKKVVEYNAINDYIEQNESFCKKIEETAQALYKEWFVDFSIPGQEIVLKNTNYIDFPNIPIDWTVKPIGELASKIASGSTPKGGKDSYKKSGIALIRNMNVHDYRFVEKDLAFIDDTQAKKLTNVEIKSRDILISITGYVGRCCIVPEYLLPARVNQHVMIIRTKKRISYFLQSALVSSIYKSRLLGTSEGSSTRQAITKKDIEDFLVLLPPETLISKFDNYIETLYLKIEKISKISMILKRLRLILLSRLTTI